MEVVFNKAQERVVGATVTDSKGYTIRTFSVLSSANNWADGMRKKYPTDTFGVIEGKNKKGYSYLYKKDGSLYKKKTDQ